MELQELFRDTWQTSIVFITLFCFTRMLGNTQIGQLTFYEYISGITIGSIAGNIVAAEPEKYFSHFYDLIIFVGLTYLFSYMTLKNKTIRNLIEGEPSILIENGIILKENMKKIRFDLDELTAQLRQQGVMDISDVQFAILETSGNLSVIKKVSEQTVTKSDINLSPSPANYPVELIMDGSLIVANLTKHHISEKWLLSELSLQGITKIEDVLYAVIDTKGKLFVNPQIKNQTE